jgi:hypothetical protein
LLWDLEDAMKRGNFYTIGFVLILSLLFPVVVLAAPIEQDAQPGMTPDEISSTAAIFLSLFFAYIPRLNTWYEGLDNQPNGGAYKRLIMLACLLVISGGAYGLACAGWLATLFGVQLVCSQAGLLGLERSFVFAVITNQATFLISPKAPGVASMKSIRAGTVDIGIGRG